MIVRLVSCSREAGFHVFRSWAVYVDGGGVRCVNVMKDYVYAGIIITNQANTKLQTFVILVNLELKCVLQAPPHMS